MGGLLAAKKARPACAAFKHCTTRSRVCRALQNCTSEQISEGSAAVLLPRQSSHNQHNPHAHKDAHADTGRHTQLVRCHQLLRLALAGRQLQTTESEGVQSVREWAQVRFKRLGRETWALLRRRHETRHATPHPSTCASCLSTPCRVSAADSWFSSQWHSCGHKGNKGRGCGAGVGLE